LPKPIVTIHRYSLDYQPSPTNQQQASVERWGGLIENTQTQFATIGSVDYQE
jgi:hypothetical protein